MNRPSRSDYRSVVNYMVNNKPLIKAERSFVRHRGDLVTLRPGREHAWLDSAIEHALRIFHCRFIEVIISFLNLSGPRKSTLLTNYLVSVLFQSKIRKIPSIIHENDDPNTYIAPQETQMKTGADKKDSEKR